MSRVLQLHGKTDKPRRSPAEEELFQGEVARLQKADRYVIIQTDPDQTDGPLRMHHNLFPAELNLLLDQIKLSLLDQLFYEEG